MENGGTPALWRGLGRASSKGQQGVSHSQGGQDFFSAFLSLWPGRVCRDRWLTGWTGRSAGALVPNRPEEATVIVRKGLLGRGLEDIPVR